MASGVAKGHLGDDGEIDASQVEGDDEGADSDPEQDDEDQYEDLPEVRRVQLQINEMWPRREVLGRFELGK